MYEPNRHTARVPTINALMCEQSFVGVLSIALAEVRERQTWQTRSDHDNAAMTQFAQVCLEQGRYDKAFGNYRNGMY